MNARSVTQSSWPSQPNARSPRRPALALLTLYALVGLLLPVIHVQVESGRTSATHVEAQNAPCSAHDELSCSICRLTAPALPLATGVTPVAAGLCSTTTAFPTVAAFVRKTSSSPLGARAPPVPFAAVS